MHFGILLSLTLVLGCSWARADVSHLPSAGYLPPAPQTPKQDIKESTDYSGNDLIANRQQPARYRHSQIESIQPSIHLASFTVQTTVPISHLYAPTNHQQFLQTIGAPINYDVPSQSTYEASQDYNTLPQTYSDEQEIHSSSKHSPAQNLATGSAESAQFLDSYRYAVPRSPHLHKAAHHQSHNQPEGQQSYNYKPLTQIQQAPRNAPIQQSSPQTIQEHYNSSPAPRSHTTQPNYQYTQPPQNPVKQEAATKFQPNEPSYSNLEHPPQQYEADNYQRHQNPGNISPAQNQQQIQDNYSYTPPVEIALHDEELHPNHPTAYEVPHHYIESRPKNHAAAHVVPQTNFPAQIENYGQQPFENTFIVTARIQPSSLLAKKPTFQNSAPIQQNFQAHKERAPSSQLIQSQETEPPASSTYTVERIPHQTYLPPAHVQQSYITPARQQQMPASTPLPEQRVPQQSYLRPVQMQHYSIMSTRQQHASTSPNLASNQAYNYPSTLLEQNNVQVERIPPPNSLADLPVAVLPNYRPTYNSQVTKSSVTPQQQAPNQPFEAVNEYQNLNFNNQNHATLDSKSYSNNPIASYPAATQYSQANKFSTQSPESYHPLSSHLAPRNQSPSYNYEVQSSIQQNPQLAPNTQERAVTHIQSIPKTPIAQNTVPNLPPQTVGPYKYHAQPATAPTKTSELHSVEAVKTDLPMGTTTVQNTQFQGTEYAQNGGYSYHV